MKNIFTSIKMFLILLLLPFCAVHAQAVTYPVNKPGIPDQPYFISYSDDAMEPFSDAVPSDNSPVAPAPRRISIGGDLGGAGMGGEDEIDEGANASPIGAPWVLLLLAVGYAAFKFYGKRRFALETANESNMKNTSIMKKINDKIRSSFSTRIAAVLLMLITMSVGQVWGRTIYLNTSGASSPYNSTQWWAHIWEGSEGNGDKAMTMVETNVYQVEVGNCTKIIFVPNSGTGSTWTNQTDNITIDGSKNCYNITAKSAGTWSVYDPDACTFESAPIEVLSGTNVMFYFTGYNGRNYLSNGSNSSCEDYSVQVNNSATSYISIAKTNLNTYKYVSNNCSGWGGKVNSNIPGANGGELFTTNDAVSKTDAKTASTTANVDGGTLNISTTANSATGVYNNLKLYIQYYLDNEFIGVTYNTKAATYCAIKASTSAVVSTFDVSGLSTGTHKLKTILTDGNIYYIADEDDVIISPLATYTLTVTKGANITSVSGGKAGQASVPFNSNISATPATGYDFAGWTASPAPNAEFGNAANASTTVTVKNGSVTVTANATEHMNTITIVGGTTASATAGIATTGSATANVPAGMRFTGWTIPGSNFTLSGCSVSNQTITFNATAAGTVTANYVEDLTTGWKLQGPTTNTGSWPASAEFMKKAGESTGTVGYVEKELAASTTYYIQISKDGTWYGNKGTITGSVNNWTFDDTSYGANCTLKTTVAGTYIFKLDYSTKKLSVTYPALVTHAVTFGVHSSGNGTLAAAVNSTAISSGDEVEQGRTVNFTATPSSGYEVAGWYSNSECTSKIDAAGTSTTYNPTVGAADLTVYVKFVKTQYTLTYAACTSGNGSVSGTVASGSLQDPNTEVTLTATPDEGYYLRGWYSDAAGNTRLAYAKKTDEYKYVVTLDANKTVYAKFETIPTGLKLDGNLCGRSWNHCMDASTYSGGVYTWTWSSVTNTNNEFCIKNSTCSGDAVVKPNMENVTFDGTNCTIADGGGANHNFKISHEVGDLTVTLTYGSGIYVNATKASDELATGWYLAGSMNAWSNNNASYQFKLDPDHTDETIGYLTLHLNSNVDFKISNGTTQFANKDGENNSGTMTVDNCTNWTFKQTSVSGNHTTLRTNGEGDYTFVLNYTTKKVSVIYPNNRYIKSSWNNSWGTAAKMTYKAGTYTIQYKSVPASSNHQFVFCYADKGDMYHANASGVVMSNSTTTLSDDGSNHNFTFATTQTGDITITLTESGGTKDVRVAFSGKDISNLTVEVFHNYDGSNWTGKTLTKEGVNYVQTAHFYSTMYYQLRVDGATIVNQRASNLPGAGECIDGEDAKWVYDPHTEILSVQPIGGRHVIYFQNTVEWNDVFVYFYNGSYWDDAKGSGAKSGGTYLGVHQMTHVDDGLYSYTFTGTLPTEVCFAKVNQDTYENFDDNECAYAGAFAEENNLYTPNPENPVRKNEHDGHYSLYYSGAWGKPTEYQVVVTMNNHIEYTSNKVMRTGKTVSFFAPQDGDVTYAGGTVELRANGVKVGGYITGFAAAGVYVATVNSTGDGLVDIAPYTGDYYVRSACVGGDGLMTFFERRPTETYSYYKCLFTGDGKTVDVKATVANDYNENLSTMIGVDKFTTAEGKVYEGNVRYSYEPTTNDFRRAVIGGSTKSDKFLNVVGDHIYKEVGLTTLLNQTHYNSTPEDSKFDDISDWVYEKTTYVNITNSEDASDVVVMSLFNSQTDYLLGYEKDPVTGYDTDNPRQLTVVGKNSTPGVYKIRIIYDYKRNRLLSAWSPDDITIDSNLQINADVMFVRHEDEDAAQIKITHGSDATVSSLKSVMFVLEMQNDGKNSANYWLSLPYDCRISDIFGVDGYGTLWAIQRYDGETRSHGWYAHDTETFWTWMDRDEVLHAGEGYVLTFVKKNAHWSNVKIGGVTRSILRLYFPSQQVGFTMSEAEGSALTKTFEPMICDLIVRNAEGEIVERGDRRAVDSNWRLIGPMSYNNITIDNYVANDAAEGHWYTTPPQFLYEYLGKSATAHQRYSVTTTEGYEYHSFHSYMTQYAGTITWVPYTQAVSSVAARRVEGEGFTHTNMCLNLIQNDTVVLDRTYVSLDQHATNGYDQNLDLTKITDSKRSQIYSVSGDAYAGNTLPLETDTVALTINAAAAGDYVISMPEPNNDVEPMLYDAEMDMTTPLNLSDYTITLSKGTHANRFFLILGRKAPGVATDLENVTTEELNLPIDRTQKLLINGEVYLLRDGYIYDAIGRRVR